MATRRQHTSLRLSPEAIRLRQWLSERLGISLQSVVEQAVRELARRYDAPAPKSP